jgi:hypothetical protein
MEPLHQNREERTWAVYGAAWTGSSECEPPPHPVFKRNPLPTMSSCLVFIPWMQTSRNIRVNSGYQDCIVLSYPWLYKHFHKTSLQSREQSIMFFKQRTLTMVSWRMQYCWVCWETCVAVCTGIHTIAATHSIWVYMQCVGIAYRQWYVQICKSDRMFDLLNSWFSSCRETYFSRMFGNGYTGLAKFPESNIQIFLNWILLCGIFPSHELVTFMISLQSKFCEIRHCCHSVSAICKICGFHGSDYEEWCLLGCYAVWFL